MISRLWYFVIAAIAGAAVAAAYVAQGTLDYRSAQSARESLRRDRAELELMLRTDARNRLDSLGPMAAHEEVRTALAAASNGRRGLDSAARTRLGNTLAQLNGQLQEGAAQLLFALDANGAIVAQLGGTTPPAGAGIGAFPVAERALRGYLTDDVLVYSDGQNPAIYRAAARPVVQGNRYVGAIVHCSEIGADLANRLSSRLGDVSLAFFFRGEITTVDADAPGVSRAELETGLAAALEAPELNERGHSEVVELPNDGVGVFVLAKGTARHAGAGYAIARTPAVLGSPMALFDAVPDAVMGSVNWLLVVAVPLVLALLGVLFFFLERDRPFSGFRKLAEAVGAGSAPHFDEAGVPARFRKIAHSINEALGRGGGGLAAPKAKADLDEILGQAGSSSSSPYFGFADGKEDAPKNDLFDAAPKPVLEPPGAELDDEPQPTTVAALPAGPPSVPPAATALPSTPKPPPPAPLMPESPFDDDDESGATMVAAVPDELIAASQTSPLERHYRQVYDDFIAMKHRLGEATVGLTYEKLLATLEKNANAIKSKHGVAEVRFKVYEKNGKAALKATPVK